jgi:deazaflavin-dependent oxidoreductase (nitroreductase family)
MTQEMQERAARNRAVIEEFRASGGSLPGRSLLLLTTTGARTGARRTTPLAYLPDGERLVVIASNYGGPVNPDWYYNLLANPAASVEVGGETFAVRAVVTEGEERERLYARQAERAPVFAEYAQRAPRTIPVIALERIG